MKTTRLYPAIALVLLVAHAAPAQALDLSSFGVTVISTQADGARTVYELKDLAGNRLTVVGNKEVTEAQARIVVYLRDALTGWKDMNAPSLRITLSGLRAEARMVPSRYIIDGSDLAAFLPSGMQFYFDTILEYDFRMKVGSIFLRMKGQFFDEAALGARMLDASRDPIRFLERTDPEYLYRTLQEVTVALKGLESGGENAMQSLRDLITDYQAQKARMPTAERKIDDLGEGQAELSAALDRLAADYQTLRRELDALRTSHEARVQADEAEIARLRLSMLTLHNTGLFRGPTAMDPALVSRAVELRRSNAAMRSAEIVAALKAEGISASAKQVELILSVYFPSEG